MRRMLATGLAAATFLALAPSAQAKGLIVSVGVCGRSGCGPQVGGDAAHRLTRDLLAGMDGAEALTWAPPPIASYYHVVPAGEGGFADADLFWVPASHTLCTDRGCLPLGPRVEATLRSAAKGIRPLSPGIRAVVVDGRTVSDPSAYMHLYDPRPRLPIPGTRVFASRHVYLELRGPRSPWTIGGRGLAVYFPRDRLLELDGRWSRPPAALDRRIRSDAGLVPSRVRPAGAVAAGVVVAAGAAAAAGAALRRRRRRVRSA